jgi:threonine dehydrogenase-like Zn-dependent dehydrogenase
VRAICWNGKHDVRVETVPDPRLIDVGDVIVRVTSTAICGSDLHLYNGLIPSMERGDVLGHEFMGEVVEVGAGVRTLSVGDRVVVPFPIACGACAMCAAQLFSLCENTNPNAGLAKRLWGHSPAGLFGYSHLLGGYSGGQAEYVRVPFADVGPIKVPAALSDEQVLLLSDLFPTGYMGAEMCDIEPGDVVAVWGAGPVGQLATASARLLGAERVVAIDRLPARLALARSRAGATDTLDDEEVDVQEALEELTAGRGPDACIDAEGAESHGPVAVQAHDRIKHALWPQGERPLALHQAIRACRNGGVVSVVGVHGGLIDRFPMGAVMSRSLTIRAGQCHVQRYLRPLLGRIERGDIDPSFVVTHRMSLEHAPAAYELFLTKRDGCEKIVLAA